MRRLNSRPTSHRWWTDNRRLPIAVVPSAAWWAKAWELYGQGMTITRLGVPSRNALRDWAICQRRVNGATYREAGRGLSVERVRQIVWRFRYLMRHPSRRRMVEVVCSQCEQVPLIHGRVVD